jgi:mono/diheme cytochrome c family protein
MFALISIRQFLAVCAVALMLVPIVAGQKKARSALRSASAASVARGKYLVEGIGMCGDCHTPRNERGEPIKEQRLKGATLGFKPAAPVPVWAEKSGDIAGLPGWDKNAAIRFFMTGIAPNELPARPPMPQYRYSEQDAVAVVAYLQSLGEKSKEH